MIKREVQKLCHLHCIKHYPGAVWHILLTNGSQRNYLVLMLLYIIKIQPIKYLKLSGKPRVSFKKCRGFLSKPCNAQSEDESEWNMGTLNEHCFDFYFFLKTTLVHNIFHNKGKGNCVSQWIWTKNAVQFLQSNTS